MTDLYRGLERAMRMDDAVWRRHANPWSGWSRVTILPLFCLAIWARVWIGHWSWALVLLLVLWTWLNPRVFPEPARLTNWMSRGVMGEYLFLHHRDAIAAHHGRAAHILATLSLPGFLVMAWGLWALWWEGVVFGCALTVLPKMWFIDRMVWILEDWRAGGRMMPNWEDRHV